MLYQFDGFSAQFTRRSEGWTKKIRDVVDARAKELKMPTWLEWDEEQLAELEWAQLYEELKGVTEGVPCTLEDESTYKYLESYYKKIK
jgi:hypothetical protein